MNLEIDLVARYVERLLRRATDVEADLDPFRWTTARSTADDVTGNAMSFSPIPELLEEIRAGRMVVIVDDEDRENEGDLIMAAELVRPQDINFMVTHARGLVCLSLTRERCRQLGLPPMVRDNTSPHHTNFTVSIEAAEGVTTGISAYDRAHTIRTAVRPDARRSDLSQPGHIFPLMAQPGGVLNRAGHTEAASDLALLAGLEPAGVLVEILNPDGSMARRPELEAFAAEHGLKIGSIEELIRYRLATEHTVERVDAREIETEHGPFQLLTYRDRLSHAPAFRPAARARPIRRRRRWCACICRTRWPTRCIGGVPDFGPAVGDVLGPDRRAKGVARWCCWPTPPMPRRCWRASADRSMPSDSHCRRTPGHALAEWRRNGAGGADPGRPRPGQAARARHPAQADRPGRLRPGSGRVRRRRTPDAPPGIDPAFPHRGEAPLPGLNCPTVPKNAP